MPSVGPEAAPAFREIHRHGFRSASLNNILPRTGLTKGALYHYFPTKDAVGFVVIDEVVREGLDAMVFAPLRESATPFATLLEVVRLKADRADSENVSLGCPLNNLMQEMSPLDASFSRAKCGVMSMRARRRCSLFPPGRVVSASPRICNPLKTFDCA